MKKTWIVLLLLLTLLFCSAACGKNNTKETTLDPNAVLTDSDVPLDLGAEFEDGENANADVTAEA